MDSRPFEPIEFYTLQRTLETPSHITSLAFGHAGHLFAGSDDGVLRVYDLSSFKVLRAVRGLGAEVSSIICVKRPGSELRDAWLACGKRVMKFQMDTPKVIQAVEDAIFSVDLSEPEDDVLNEIALNINKTHLAFSMDSGMVGVIDLSTKEISRMKTKHESICTSVKFIPDRPREIVSGGCDTAILHFDFVQNDVLSRLKIPPFTVTGGMALAPPFIMSTAMSSTGVMAAGTADGRLWLGFGGEKRPSLGNSKKKRTKKWEGLRDDDELAIKIAEGPIVAMAFDESGILTVSTLLGMMIRYNPIYDPVEGSIELDKLWQKETESIEKVNTLVVDEKRVVVGGLTGDGKGVFEIWKR